MTDLPSDPDPGDAPAETFSWKAHPARERRTAAWVAGLMILAISLGAAVAGGHLAWAILAVVILLAALNRFFFPSRFALDDRGITARYPLSRRRLEWRNLRRFARDAHGGFLSTRARGSWLDSYRGMHILFGTDRRSVEAQITAFLPEGGAP